MTLLSAASAGNLSRKANLEKHFCHVSMLDEPFPQAIFVMYTVR